MAVLGLARTGAAAAEWLFKNGFRVYGSDAATPNTATEELDALRAGGVAIDLGGHDLSRVCAASVVVVSPGIGPEAPALVAARECGVEIIAELELASAALGSTRMVAITGTNGKTTTTALIGQILKRAGVSNVVGGNIGEPLIKAALDGEPPDWAVVEASSFQLHDCYSFSPDIGVFTNLAPDHLDRYPDVDAYFADKKRLFTNAGDDSIWITCADDSAVAALKGDIPGIDVQWSLESKGTSGWYDRGHDRLVLDGEILIGRTDIRLLGDHNVANALAAALACSRIGVSPDVISASLAAARPLPHRLEVVQGTGVRWINDSKATNVSSTAVAIAAMSGSYALMMGGRHKGESYFRLGDLLAAGQCAGVIAFGEASETIIADLGGTTRVIRAGALADAVAKAADTDASTVLFSPACSSFDEFHDYEHRGAEFKRLVGRL